MKHLFLTASIICLAGPALAQTAASDFAAKAAVGDMFEIQTSELAEQRSRNADVQSFARKIIQDHRANSEELKALIQRSNDLRQVQLPTALDAPHQQKMQRLRNDSAFEPQYRALQIEAHQEAIKLFEDYARGGDDAELKAWAGGKVPVLRGHLEMAQALPQAATPSTNVAQPQQPTPPQTGAQRQLSAMATPGPDHIMASDLEGTTVRSAADENVGEIDDVVLDRSGRIVAVIVGVGGFLGIGEKDVAIPFEALEIVGDDNARTTQPAATGAPNSGTVGNNRATAPTTVDPSRVVLKGMTKDDLQKAPAFKAGSR